MQNIAPQNSLEAALATQMAAVHSAMMDMARRLASTTNFQQVDVYEQSMNKLARTFTTQMETLKKFRSKNSAARQQCTLLAQMANSTVGNLLSRIEALNQGG